MQLRRKLTFGKGDLMAQFVFFMNNNFIIAATVASAGILISCGGRPAVDARGQEQKTAEKVRRVAVAIEDPHWNYEERSGPEKWGTLSKKWAACREGRAQSPIDFDETSKANLPALKAEFKPTELKIVHHEHMADVVNTGHSVQINYTEGDKLELGPERFELLQYHFHSPSEHTVRGKHYPMEMHMVHKSDEGKLAVIGVFIEEGSANPAFEPVWANLPNVKGFERHLSHVTVDVNDLLPKSAESYRYTGSLTTPPCSEGVKWIVMTAPVELSSDQIRKFREIVKGNNRPPQPLSGRSVVTDQVVESTIQ